MKNIKLINILLFGLPLMFLVHACNKDTFKNADPGKSSTYPLNGEYWVQLDSATITGIDTAWAVKATSPGYQKIIISNLATNKGDSIWVDDQNFFPFKVKSACNPALKTFSVTNGLEIYGDSIVTIKNGKLILGKGITKSGNKTDSIHMHVHYGADIISLYRLSGVRRTGFQADDY